MTKDHSITKEERGGKNSLLFHFLSPFPPAPFSLIRKSSFPIPLFLFTPIPPSLFPACVNHCLTPQLFPTAAAFFLILLFWSEGFSLRRGQKGGVVKEEGEKGQRTAEGFVDSISSVRSGHHYHHFLKVGYRPRRRTASRSLRFNRESFMIDRTQQADRPWNDRVRSKRTQAVGAESVQKCGVSAASFLLLLRHQREKRGGG